MSLEQKIQSLSQIANAIQTLNTANVSIGTLNDSAKMLAADILNLVKAASPQSALTQSQPVTELTQMGSAESDKQTVNTKKETAPKATPKKVTAAAIIEDKPEVKPEEPALEVEDEVSLTDEEPKKLEVDFSDEDFEALRTECRTLINKAVDRVGKPEVVRILANMGAKSLKDINDVDLKFLKFELLSAK